jgi:hypothetical protein
MFTLSPRERTLLLGVALSLGVAELFLELQKHRAREAAGAFPSPLQPRHFTNAVHLTDEGNKLFAEYTLPFIRSCALEEPGT